LRTNGRVSAWLDAPRAAPPPLAVPITDAVVPAPTTELHAPAAGESDGSSATAVVDESDGPQAFTPTSGKPDVGSTFQQARGQSSRTSRIAFERRTFWSAFAERLHGSRRT
jgi:hypothetical protein